MPQNLDEIREQLHEHNIRIQRANDKIEHTFDKLTTTIGHLDGSVANLTETVDLVRTTVFGGGHETPLFSRVAVLEEQTKFHNETIKSILEQNSKFLKEDKSQRFKVMGLVALSTLGMTALLFAYATDSKLFEWVVKLFK